MTTPSPKISSATDLYLLVNCTNIDMAAKKKQFCQIPFTGQSKQLQRKLQTVELTRGTSKLAKMHSFQIRKPLNLMEFPVMEHTFNDQLGSLNHGLVNGV